LWIKIVTAEHFDRQEFTGGDCIYLRNCKVVLVVAPTSTNSHSKQSAIDRLTAFLNRSEGHEVVQIGQANERGFYTNYYVLAPGTLDSAAGKFTLDLDLIDLIQTINSDTTAASYIVGDMINTTLQVSATLKITTSH
jgi:hypothetical protein